MSAALRPIFLQSRFDSSPVLSRIADPERPAVLLSASVPYARERKSGMTDDQWQEEQARNRLYRQHPRQERIRLAVEALIETALMDDIRIVFGAHPAISPMVLSAARALGALPDSIIIFQSNLFAGQLPKSTLQLADWSHGRLVFTPEDIRNTEYESYRRSLITMREMMVSWPSLIGAFFVGGMDGTEEEAQFVRRLNTNVRRYALASTGAAAEMLFNASPADYSGTLSDRSILAQYPCSYKLVARRIFGDLRAA